MRKSKLLMIVLSAVIAIVLWLYVVTVVSPESEATLYNIPVVLQGESVLDERGLVLVSENNYKINLQLYGNRIDLNKVNSGNVTIIADLEKIYDPGSHNLSYTIMYPGDVPSGAFTEMSRVPSRLKVTVEQKITKSIPVEVTYSGSVPLDYRAKTDSIVLDYKEVSITGPASVINQIEKAVVKVDLSNRSETFEQSCRFALCNKDNEPVDAATVTTNVAEVTVTVPIQFMKYLPVTVELIPGGGADETNTKVTYYAQKKELDKIRVAGSKETLMRLTEIKLKTINLGELTKDTKIICDVVLPAGVDNVSLVHQVEVMIEFPDLLTKSYVVTQFAPLNVPEGMTAEILNQTLTVRLRGPREKIAALTSDDITVEVDFTNVIPGTSTVKVNVVINEGFAGIGVLGNYSINATLGDATEDEK